MASLPEINNNNNKHHINPNPGPKLQETPQLYQQTCHIQNQIQYAWNELLNLDYRKKAVWATLKAPNICQDQPFHQECWVGVQRTQRDVLIIACLQKPTQTICSSKDQRTGRTQ